MCILRVQHNVTASRVHLHYFQTTRAAEKGTLIYFRAGTGERARAALTHSILFCFREDCHHLCVLLPFKFSERR